MITYTDVINISLPNKALSVINAGTMTINVTANVVAMATLVSDSYLRNCWIDRSCGRAREGERGKRRGMLKFNIWMLSCQFGLLCWLISSKLKLCKAFRGKNLQWMSYKQQISLPCFLGKVKNTGSISQIYTSLWKPWSYLAGSSDADSTGTASPDVTSQQTTTIRGVTFICSRHMNQWRQPSG